MNSSLLQQYDNMANVHRPKILSNQIIPDTNWGKKIQGVTLQIDVSENVRDEIKKIQKKLMTLEPDLLILPKRYQHISVNQIVFWGGTYKEGCEKTWKNIEHDFLTQFKLLNNSVLTFPIIWNRIFPMGSAIILAGVDENDEMNILRQKLFEKLPFPIETTRKNTIIHTTIARYKMPLHNPEKLLTYLDSLHPNMIMKPESIILRKENVYPSIDTTEIARIDLRYIC